MNNPWLAPQSSVGAFVWTVAWQSTLWLALGLVAGRLLRRHAAQAHWALLLAVAAAVISPALTVAVGHFEWGVIPPFGSTTATAAQDAQLVGASSDQLPLNQPVEGTTVPRERVPSIGTPPSAATLPIVGTGSWFAALREHLPIALLAIWIACSLALSIRLARSLWAGGQVVRQALAETHAGLLTALADAAHALAIRSEPILRISAVVSCPMIWCWGRQPVLLTPASVVGHGRVSWRSVFCHELAHWLRRDHWAVLCADLAVIAVPWQPLAWRVRRSLAVLREQACDDWVLASGGEAADYAESLLSLVPQRMPVVGLSVLGKSESLKHRLDRLFAGVRVAPRVGNKRIAITLSVVLAAVVGVALAQQRPAVEQSVARSATDKPAPRAQNRPSEAAGNRRFSGRVIQPDGAPASSAQVFFIRSGPGYFVELKATTGSDGGFEFSVPADARFGGASLRIKASKPGFGPAWIDPETLKKSTDLRLTLVPDDLPIEGRIVNLEGRPVVGAAVRVVAIETFANDNPQPYLEVLKTSDARASNYRFSSWLMFGSRDTLRREVPSTLTDERGAFRLTGIGRHRRAVLVIAGDAIADTTIHVLTDPFEGMLNGMPPRFTKATYGARFTHYVRPSRPIVGTVTDAKTGRPIEGVRVNRFDGFSETSTDASGRFELRGCPKEDQYPLYASVPDRSSYIDGSLTALDTPGLGPLEMHLHVYPAIPLSGRVIDQATGKPVSAEVSYWPLYPNTHIVKGMSGTAVNSVGAFSQSVTNSDGTFSVGVLPGPGAVIVRRSAGDDFEPARVDAEGFFEREGVRYGDADMKGQVKDHLIIAAGIGGSGAMPQSQLRGIALLNVPETATQLTQNIDLRSKAKSGVER